MTATQEDDFALEEVMTSPKRSLSKQIPDDASVQSTTSRRSSVSSMGRRPSVSRPAGMRERMQDRLNKVKSERQLDAASDERSVSSRRTIGAFASSLTRSAGAATTTRRSEGDDLLIQMTRKVRQLESEKTRLQSTHDEAMAKVQKQLDRMEQKASSSSSTNSSSVPRTDSVALELQAKLDMAMSKIARLETEQSKHDDLEEKLEHAQLTIANLQLHQSTPNLNSNIRRSSLGSSASFASQRRQPQDQHLDQRQESSPQKDEGVQDRKPESPPDFKSMSMDDSESPSPSPSHPPSPLASPHPIAEARNSKLEKLKAFRQSRESQLKELVLDTQNSPTDVQTVIRNLQDEVKAAKEVISQQKVQLEQLQALVREQSASAGTQHEKSAMDANGRMSLDLNDQPTPSSQTTEEFKALQRQYVQLELNRAYGEFQLRDRITNDALKFHKRLRHWKEQSQELQTQLEQAMSQHAEEVKDLRQKVAQEEQERVAAEEALVDYKRGTQESLAELVESRERLTQLTMELSEFKHAKVEYDPVVTQQAKLLATAIERKAEREKHSWGAGLMGMLRKEGEPPKSPTSGE